MASLIKYLFYIVVLAAIGLVGYAYVGPWFGADFSAPTEEIRKPVVLPAASAIFTTSRPCPCRAL